VPTNQGYIAKTLQYHLKPEVKEVKEDTKKQGVQMSDELEEGEL
jgi:hypothetical protein